MITFLERSLIFCVFLLWIFAVASIPTIDEKCCVCGNRHGANEAETLRKQSVIDWALDDVVDLHWSCSGQYDAAIHNPNGGVK